MKCTACKKEALIKLPRHNSTLCQECFQKFIQKQTLLAIKRYHMFAKDEPVLLAVSGGKDSMSLWQILHLLGDQVHAIHIDLGIGDFSRNSRLVAEEFARNQNWPLTVIDVKMETGYNIPETLKLTRRPACSACGLVKRYLLNRYALANHFPVVATGHNLDDEAANLLGNILRWREDYLAHQSPILPSFHAKLAKKVKPFYTLTDDEIRTYAQFSDLPFCDEICPLSQRAKSLDYKKALALLEKQSPGTKHYFWLT
ncbi:MAG: tRNA 2-thiocytidine biosynthesis TtcA family protein, partial [Atribacterota bacterium]